MIEAGSATGGGAKYSMEFDILEGVPEREYYGRSASGIAESISSAGCGYQR